MKSPRLRWALSIQATLAQAAWVGIRIIVGYRAIELGSGPFFLSMLAASFALPTIVAALPAGRISDRIGGSAVAFTGIVVAAGGLVLMLLAPKTVAALILSTLIIGFGHLLIMVGQQTFVAHATRAGSRDAGFGTLTAAASVGQLIGPPAVTVSAAWNSSPYPDTTFGVLTCLGFLIVALPMIIVLRKADSERRRSAPIVGSRPPLAEVLKAPELWRTLVVSGAVLVTVDLMYTFLPLWAVARDVSPTTVGLLLALRALVSVISRLGLGRLVARFGRRTLLITSMIIGVAALTALPFAGQWAAIPVMIALGIALGIPQPLTMAWTTAITPRAAHGAALGLRLTANRVAQVAIPLAVGAVAGPLGMTSIFWANAVVLTIGVVTVATSRTSNSSGPEGER